MDTVANVLNSIRTLSPDEIRRRLADLDAQQKTLRVLLRARLDAQAKVDRPDSGKESPG